MWHKVERVKKLVQLVCYLSPGAIMKLKSELVDAMDDLVIESLQCNGDMDHLVECECSRGKFSMDRE
jgi:hypothetical protein